jgi:hypothetical protein
MMTKREKLLGCAFAGAVLLAGMAMFGPWNPLGRTGPRADPALPANPQQQFHPGNSRSAKQRKEPSRTLATADEAKEWARGSNAEAIAELRAGGISAARKQELLSSIVGRAFADPGEVMAFIEEPARRFLCGAGTRPVFHHPGKTTAWFEPFEGDP